MNILEKVALKHALVDELVKQASALGKTPGALRTAKWRISELTGHGTSEKGQRALHMGSRDAQGPLTEAVREGLDEARERTSVARQHAGLGALGAAGVGALGYGLHRAMRPSGSRFVRAVKAHKGKLLAAGGAAAGLAGLAAYRKRNQ